MDSENNRMWKVFNELKDLCKRAEDLEINDSHFNPPADENEINDWERTNDIILPDSYKDWLRFSNGSQILGFEATLFSVGNIVTDQALIPAEMAIVGHLGGSGKILCFSKETGIFHSLHDGNQKDFDSFRDVILELVRSGKDILGMDVSSSGVTAKLMAMLEAQRQAK